MPLNHVTGERLEGMDDFWLVVPFEKYAAQARLTTVIEEKVPLKRPRKVEKPIVTVAMNFAAEAFAAKGLRIGKDIDILVQEFPRTGCVAFVFCAKIGLQEYYVTAPFKLGEDQIRDLTLRGLWTPYRVH